MSFDKLNLIAPIRQALDEKGYNLPTPIQIQAIPHILRGKDLQACAPTGAGKTGAFIIPIIQNLITDEIHDETNGHLRALLISPTRELAIQIRKSFETYGKYSGLKCMDIFEIIKNENSKELISTTDILVSTPGKLLELVKAGTVSLDNIKILVIDEAEKYFEIGISNELNELRKRLPEKKQTLMFYETKSSNIERLTKEILVDPVIIETSVSTTPIDKIRQAVYYVNTPDKPALLLHLIKEEEIQRAVVFIKSKEDANKIVDYLNSEGISSQAYHGKLSQIEREIRLQNLITDKIKVLVATDLATKGVDIENLTHVINFEIPFDGELYVQRIRLAGSNGVKGFAFSFCDNSEIKFVNKIELHLGEKIRIIENHPFVIEINNSAYALPAPSKSKRKYIENDNQYDYITSKAAYAPQPPPLKHDEESDGKKKRKRLVKKEQTFMSSSIPKEKNQGKK